MSPVEEIMEHCRGIHNALDRVKWNSLDSDRCEQINALQSGIKAFMQAVDRIPLEAKHSIRPVWRAAEGSGGV